MMLRSQDTTPRSPRCLLVLSWLLAAAVASYAQQVPFRVTKLIGDLNDTVETNRKAREEFVKLGEEGVPGLVGEIEKYTDLQHSSMLSAARCLRVLRAMGSEGGVDVACDILATVDQRKKGVNSVSRVLLSEALAYLAACSPQKKAKAAVLRFVGHDPVTAGWLHMGPEPPSESAQKGQHTLLVDVFPALAILVAKKDEDVGGVLSSMLMKLPYRFQLTNTHVYTGQWWCWYLHADGFTESHEYRDHPVPDEHIEVWLDPLGRPRMLCLTWLRSLGYKTALPEIEKLLRSSEKEEREFALLVAEELDSLPNPKSQN